jgi:DNA-nicking Smr family endonuclease
MKRSRRPLSEEDRQIWDHVRRTAQPLRPLPPEPPPPDVAAEAAPKAAPPPSGKSSAAAVRRDKPKPPPGALVPLGGLDRRTLTRLGRGSVAIDARIDLHGMTQDAAHHRLLRFIEAARGEGARIVLVITGKGAPDGPEFGGAGRGVLRRAVPAWLASAPFRLHVSGYESAGRRHGGEGALYVRLRRKGPHDAG